MWKFAATISYDGTGFCGWQRQTGSAAEGGPSLQGTVEAALKQITSEDVISVVGSGRTDSGVHALGQVVHFVLRRKQWEPWVLQRGLNSLLRPRIQVREVWPVAIEFHAQRSAEKKQYSYYFQQGPCALPHLAPFSWWIQRRLDLTAINQALPALRGEHDFKPFQASGAKPGPTVRRILEAEATFEPLQSPWGFGQTGPGIELADAGFGLVRVRLVGTGFLKQMVRGICGTLLQVGESRRDPACIAEILRSGRRVDVGPTAPARALWLERVWYRTPSSA